MLVISKNSNLKVHDKINRLIDNKMKLETIRVINDPDTSETERQRSVNVLLHEIYEDATDNLCRLVVEASRENSPLTLAFREPDTQAKIIRKLIDGAFRQFKKDNEKYGASFKEVDKVFIAKMSTLAKAGLIAYPSDPNGLRHTGHIFTNPSNYLAGHLIAKSLSELLDVPYEHIVSDGIVNYFYNCVVEGVTTQQNSPQKLDREARRFSAELTSNLQVRMECIAKDPSDANRRFDVTSTSEDKGKAYHKCVSRFMRLYPSRYPSALRRLIDYGQLHLPQDVIAKLKDTHISLFLTDLSDRNVRPKRPKL